MRHPIILSPLVLALALARSSPAPLPPVPDTAIAISATPVMLDSAHPGRRDVGALHFLGAWALRSDEPAFGGLSGAVMGRNEIITVSDSGAFVRIGLTGGKPDGRGHIAPLPQGCGTAGYKADRDAEAMTGDPATGRIWVSLERRNAICRLRGLATTEAEIFPPVIAKWPGTTGGEALLRLPDGHFLMWSESQAKATGLSPLLRFDRDPTLPGVTVESMRWRAPSGFRPVDATRLPDGRILVLHRRFSFIGWFRSMLSVVDPKTLGHGGIVESREIARIDGSLIRDNYEGLAVDRENGRTIVWIISDDNFYFLQRTLLLKFAFDG